ncbi:integrase [Bifidobacterium pseudolongum subsp. globosum]|uniref:Integrase n=1 Tax=Bifidobacterium pseudolongum subsp. globosum TaxID=1690 RepID=A0A4Q5BCB2_9BIFI|nr:integrase [Bifidobacterium pseudolongum subsp. globosum]
MVTITSYETAAGRRWEVRYRKPNGRSTRKRGFERRRDAEAWMAEHVVTAIATNSYVAPSAGAMTVGMLWGKYVAAHEGVWKPSHLHSGQCVARACGSGVRRAPYRVHCAE